MNRVMTWLYGRVRVRVECAFPERCLNWCGANGIAFHALERSGDTTVSFTVSKNDWERLRGGCAAFDGQCSVESRRGAPFALCKLKQRRALCIGIGAFALLLVVNSFFIWDYRVVGNETVPTEEIIRQLEKNGVRRGSFALFLKPQEICNHILPEMPSLAWLTVYVRGCRACVQVKERVPKPVLQNEKQTSNVVSRKAGVVTKVVPLDGEAMVLPGQTVLPGQLLISGVVETKGVEKPSIASRIYAGTGEVWGRTWYTVCAKIPLQYEVKGEVQKTFYGFGVQFGKKTLKFHTKGSSNLLCGYDKIVKRTSGDFLSLTALPISWETETVKTYPIETAKRTREEAEAIGKETLMSYLIAQVAPSGKIVSTRFATALQGDILLVTCTAEGYEQLGTVVPILME